MSFDGTKYVPPKNLNGKTRLGVVNDRSWNRIYVIRSRYFRYQLLIEEEEGTEGLIVIPVGAPEQVSSAAEKKAKSFVVLASKI